MTTMEWEWHEEAAGSRVLIVHGELDVATGGTFAAAVEEVLAANDDPDEVIIDLSDVEFIDSSGLRALLQLRREHADRVRISEVSPVVHRLLELTGTLEHLGLETEGG